ncbi:unnamed protein product, partial [marine sediment metagenome]
LHDNPGMQIRCIPCALADMTTHEGALEGTIADLTPAQLEEIEEGLRARKN